ncbi:hypothetical protein QC763_0019280 [Podospora pseudopauciseta]|uniref:Uncharacterized protein n=1 Tax=Podospora pseudopauciseta TaxID=2093780 RepID=A0ABR0I142_9PEZI|nr:hypothetical protein QC763_0019280 [Podospora pseudopauciseta]
MPTSYLIRRLVENGKELLVDIPVDDRNRLQPDLPSLKGQDSTLEAAIVLVARDSAADFLEAAEGPTRPNRPWNFPVRNMLVFRYLCAKVWDLDKNKGLAILPYHDVDRILKAILETKDFEFFEKAASQTEGRMSSSFFYWAAGMIKAGSLAMMDIEKGLVAAILRYP